MTIISENRRLEAVRVMLKMTKKQMMKELKTNNFTYDNVVHERKPIPSNWLSHLYAAKNVSSSWILHGKGEVLC